MTLIITKTKAMKTIFNTHKINLLSSLVIFCLTLTISSPLCAQKEDPIITIIEINDTIKQKKDTPKQTLITITVKADTNDGFENIQYMSIEMSDIIDFDKLLKVYINSNSIILLDKGPVSMDNVRTLVYDKLQANVENSIGTISQSTIADFECEMKILVRKSIYTNKEDYKAILDNVNNAIWDLHNYYSNAVYGQDYKSLNFEEKNTIKRLLPLKNFLANDVTF